MYNFDPNNVFLAIATNMPELLMTCAQGSQMKNLYCLNLWKHCDGGKRIIVTVALPAGQSMIVRQKVSNPSVNAFKIKYDLQNIPFKRLGFSEIILICDLELNKYFLLISV